MTLYKQWRKHQEGKALSKEPGYKEDLQSANVLMPEQHHLDEDKWYRRWNPLNTKASRTHDLVRGQVAAMLEDSHHPAYGREEIVENLGLKPSKPYGQRGEKAAKIHDIARELEG